MEIYSAATAGSEGKLIYLMYFPQPPMEAGLKIFTLTFSVKKLKRN
jgi:hypothetical protein